MLENLTPGQIALLIFGGLPLLAGFINSVGSAVERCVKVVKAAKAPNDKQNERIEALEAWQKIVDVKLNNDNERLDAIVSDNRITQRALLALLDHGIDGNNIKQMQDAKTVLQKHLINR